MEGNGKEGFVFALADDKQNGGSLHVRKLPVQIGFLDNDKVLLTNGLSDSQKVITAGSAYLTEESSVVVK